MAIIYSIRKLMTASPKFTTKEIAAVLKRLIRDRNISKYYIQIGISVFLKIYAHK